MLNVVESELLALYICFKYCIKKERPKSFFSCKQSCSWIINEQIYSADNRQMLNRKRQRMRRKCYECKNKMRTVVPTWKDGHWSHVGLITGDFAGSVFWTDRFLYNITILLKQFIHQFLERVLQLWGEVLRPCFDRKNAQNISRATAQHLKSSILWKY